jgi:hypothetical protein
MNNEKKRQKEREGELGLDYGDHIYSLEDLLERLGLERAVFTLSTFTKWHFR